jgi:hypothetical protein
LLEEISQWLAARQKLVVILLLVFSVLIRATYYLEARDGPLLSGHLWSDSNMSFFDHWAKVIVHDDPLGRQPLHPFFFCQTGTAEDYFRAHPEQIAQSEAAGVPHGNTEALYRALWCPADDPQLVRFFAMSHLTLGNELQKAGDPARASMEFASAKELGAPVEQ